VWAHVVASQQARAAAVSCLCTSKHAMLAVLRTHAYGNGMNMYFYDIGLLSRLVALKRRSMRSEP
jgi:hypothetical protein